MGGGMMMGSRCPRMLAVGLLLGWYGLMFGCVSYRHYEVDASQVTDFQWNGKIQIVERTEHKPAPWFVVKAENSISRVDLVGEDGRHLVMLFPRPGQEREPAARVQAVGRPPERTLSQISRTDPVLHKMVRQAMRLAVRDEAPFTREESDTYAQYVGSMSRLRDREYGQMNAKEAAFACALSLDVPFETVYELDSYTFVRVRVEEQTLLSVRVEDRAGNVIHAYEPELLEVIPVEK